MQPMDNFTFGVTVLIVGMGGTILTLWIMSVIMTVLMKVFPYKEEEQPK
jgi:Na+-transporting methylmalonyl-CoA/oxaloacetate decarboxylase gamma subunit